MEYFTKLEEAVNSKKLKLFKDAVKEISAETEITRDDYKKLALIATEINATPILKHIFKTIEPDKELLSQCFLIANKNNKVKIVEYLLELGADINAVTEDGSSALIISIKNNKAKTMDFLLEAGININLTDNNGYTALHHAIEMKKSKLVEALVNKDADLNIENNNGLVPLALAWNQQVTPAIINLILDKNTTNMIGEAGEKIIQEAFKIKGKAKKEERRKIWEIYLEDHNSKMTEEEFIKKHGEIKEISSYIGKLPTPNHSNDETIMKGIFTNIGYFPRGVDYKNMKHNWDALDHAIEFSNKLVKILNTADCYAPNTEGGSDYEAFFIPYAGWRDLISFDSKPSGEALDESSGAYNKWPTSYSTYSNVFFEDIEEHLEDGFIDKKEYDAFKEVSDLMKENLKDITSLLLYPDFVEFPWLFIGLDKYRNLVGVVTSAVWT